MIEAIKEINFPVYATLSQATAVLNDMGDRTITADVKIDGSVIPDFSYDWEVEFKGERYIQPLRKPHAIKDNKSLRSTISLTFYHWAIYQLKRDYFVELASTQAGTAFADKYIVPLTVNLGEFVVAFNNVLSYYFPDGDIYIDLNPEWAYNLERQYVDINNSYLWDILQKTHELFGVRWNIERDGDNKYAIRMGYPAGELTHVFEYGFEGGLLKIERQVQDANIRNKILGRGGSKNLPYLYFKDYDKYPLGGDGNQGMIPDPDAIPELANIYFSELRDSNFRSYVQGWKTNPNRQLVEGDTLDEFNSERAESDYAYMRGATDEKFDPVEYVKDDASIAEYGELVGRLENNEDIYPSLQGMEVEITSPDGHSFITRADEIVAVQEVITDRIASEEEAVKSDIKLEAKSETQHEVTRDGNVALAQTITVSSADIEIPEGYEGTLFDNPRIDYKLEFKEQINEKVNARGNIVSDKTRDKLSIKQSPNAPVVSFKVIDVLSGNEVTPINLPQGKYRVDYTVEFPEDSVVMGEFYRQMIQPQVIGISTRLKVYWFKRFLTTSATFVCKSFNGDVILNKVDGSPISRSISVAAHSKSTVSITGDTFSVPEQGALMVDVPIAVTPKETTTYSEKVIKVVNTSTNEIVPATNIPKGNYKLLVEVTLTNESSAEKVLTVELLPAYLYFVDNNEKWQPTFDVWIKNIFNTKKSDYPSEEAYVEGVWSPLRTEDEMVLTFSSGNLSGHDSWEFRVKKGGIVYDNSKTIVDSKGNEVRSEWRLTLIKSDAELETIKKYIPYKDFNAKAGDTFFFTGIILPHQYVLSAEKDVTLWKYDNLTEVKDIKPQWVVSLDKIRAHQQDAEKIIDLLSVGSVITLKDKRFIKNVGERQILQSITYEWQESSLLPNIDVVLSEKVSTSLSTVAMLQSKVESLAKQVGGISNLEQIVRKIGDLLYLRKDGFEDTSYSPTRFSDTVSSDNFRPGAVGGTGWAAYQDENGLSVIEADKLFVRNEMLVNSIIVNQIAAFGGTKIMSAADMTISAVETVILDGDIVGDRCFFDTKGASKANLFAIDDIAYSNVFSPDNAELKYYKRRVIEVGSNYITLSTAESDGDGAPQVGDTIVHFGNFTNKDRQSFIIIDPLNGGKIEVYAGVNSFSISGCNMIGMGVNPDTNESFLYGYGDMFFGDRNGSGHFISFDKSTGKFKIKAEVTFESGSSGLENLPEWVEVKETAEEALEKAGSIGEEAFAELEAYIDNVRQELQEQIDGAVDSYFEDYEPSTTNLPAKAWSEEEKEAHLNDTFTNLTDGRSWRWSKSAGVYTWVEIADTATSEALKIAGQAKDAADKKIRMFVEQPKPPYSVGDLWSRGEEAPLMRCINAKDSGAFDEADWGLADNSQAYTDEAVGNIKLGGDNLLRNSGFTGDYLSERIADDSVLEAADELYSAPLDHWSSSNATVVDSDETVSGKAVSLTSGEISQELYYNIIAGEQYTISFKAQGSGSISCTVADVTISVPLTEEWTKYERVVTVNEAINAFRISNATCTLGDLKLESGNRASTWKPSFLDNSSDRAYWQSMKYMQSALKGATDVNGGLVLTEMIQVGDYDEESKTWRKRNGGMNGIYENDNDVAFWAGGNFEQAVATVMKYVEDPTYQPTEEELASMAKFVVTHGGNAIFNNAILRGIILAKGGAISGFKIEDDWLRAEGENYETIVSPARIAAKADGVELSTGTYKSLVNMQAYPGAGIPSVHMARVELTPSREFPEERAIAVYASAKGANTAKYDPAALGDYLGEYGGNYAFYSPYGMFAGLRPKCVVLSDGQTYRCSPVDHTLISNSVSGTNRIYLPEDPQDGQVIKIWKNNAHLLYLNTVDSKQMIRMNISSATEHGIETAFMGTIELIYHSEIGAWLMIIHETY